MLAFIEGRHKILNKTKEIKMETITKIGEIAGEKIKLELKIKKDGNFTIIEHSWYNDMIKELMPAKITEYDSTKFNKDKNWWTVEKGRSWNKNVIENTFGVTIKEGKIVK
jgi:hypothetical protein